MKKIIGYFFLFFFFLLSPFVTSAQTGNFGGVNCRVGDSVQDASAIKNMLKECQGGQGVEAYSSTGSTTSVSGIKEKVQHLSLRALQYIALFAVGVLVFAGFQYTTAYDDSEKIKKAKDTAVFALVGLVIALASYSLVNAIVYILFSLGK